MIEPQVLHGGASSWLRIAANSEPFAFGAAAGAAFAPGASTFTSVRLKPDTTSEVDGASTLIAGLPPVASAEGGSSRMFTPTRNCASGLRNLVAIQRKM